MFKSKGSKGFTLIELLAVIVVLAIIALISIPIITDVIEKAKKGAVKSSAYGLVEAGELYLANNLSKGISEDIEFTCSGSKCIKDDKEIAYKGDIDSGTLKLYTDGEITLCIEKDNYGAYKLATEKEVTVEKGTCNDDYTVDAYMSKKEYDKIKNELDELKGKGTAKASDILDGKRAVVNGDEITGTIISKVATTYTPTITDQIISKGLYLSGDQTIKGDVNLIASNIKKGVSIFGITGTNEAPSSSGSCTANVKVTLGYRPKYIAVKGTDSVYTDRSFIGFYLDGSTMGYLLYGPSGSYAAGSSAGYGTFTIYDDGFTISRGQGLTYITAG